MTTTELLAISLILLISPASPSSSPQLNIYPRYKGPVVTIVCEIQNPLPDASVHLLCPLYPKSTCFENCDHTCRTAGPSCHGFAVLNRTACRDIKVGSDKRELQYDIAWQDKFVPDGDWFCSTAGIKSLPLKLEKPTITTTASTPTAVTTTAPPSRKDRSNADSHNGTKNNPRPLNNGGGGGETNAGTSSETKEKQEDAAQRREALAEFSRTDLMISVICLLGLSLLINLAFCIRCVLVKSYIRAKKRGENNATCLETCLCISHPRGQKQHLGANNGALPMQPNNPDGIYEDPNHHIPRPSVLMMPASGDTSEIVLTPTSVTGAGSAIYDPLAHHIPRSRTFPDNRGADTVSSVLTGAGPSSSTAYLVPVSSGQISSYGQQVIYAVPVRVGNSTGLLHSSQILYDEVPPEMALSMQHLSSIRPSVSLTSLHNRTRRVASPPMSSPVPEEAPLAPTFAMQLSRSVEEVEDERDPYGRLTATPQDPLKVARLEMSKTLMRQADSLLREASNLLQ